MKKLLALLLALLMIASTLTACGKDNDEDDDDDKKPKTSQSDKDNDDNDNDKDSDDKDDDDDDDDDNDDDDDDDDDDDEDDDNKKDDDDSIAIGTILDKPEVVFDDEYDEIFVDMTSGDTTCEISIESQGGDLTMYIVTNGYEGIFEIEDNSLAFYNKAVEEEQFTKQDMDQEEIEEGLNMFIEILEYLSLTSPIYDDAEYRKAADKTSNIGKAYAYDVIIDDEVAYSILVDKKSGLVVEIIDAEDNLVLSVEELEFKANIPDYK